jgi:hypothetical protein
MGDEANELIAAAAILGLEHDVRALQATAGLEPNAAEAALDEILRARLLRPGTTPHRFAFTHGSSARRCSRSATSCAAPGFTAAQRRP